MEVTMTFKAFVVKVPTNVAHIQLNNTTVPVRFDNTVLLPNGSRLGAYFRDCDIALVRCDLQSDDAVYFKLARENIKETNLSNLSNEDREYLVKKGYLE